MRLIEMTDEREHQPICEVCLDAFCADDLSDGVTISADCCGRIGLCSHCRKKGIHDCDENGYDGPMQCCECEQEAFGVDDMGNPYCAAHYRTRS